MLRVRLFGRCNGYPSAELTMERLLREELTAAFPSLRSISLAAGISDELIDAAREMMKKRLKYVHYCGGYSPRYDRTTLVENLVSALNGQFSGYTFSREPEDADT